MAEEHYGSVVSIEELYEQGRYEEALKSCRVWLGLEPANTNLLAWRAILLRDLGRLEEAVSSFSELVRLYADAGEYLKAISISKDLALLDPVMGNELVDWLAAQYSEQYGDSQPSTLTSMPSFSVQEDNDPSIRELLQQIESEMLEDDEGIGEMTMLQPMPVGTNVSSPEVAAPEAASSGVLERNTSQDAPLPALFSQLDPASISAILTRMKHIELVAGDEIIRQGSIGDSFYVVIEGSVSISHRVEEEEEELGVLEAGQFFGEIALLTPLRRTATVTAKERCKLLELSRSDLQSIVELSPHVYEELQRFVYQRLIQNLLTTSLLFFPLPDSKRWELAQQFNVLDVSDTTTLLAEGEGADGLYLIAGGSVGIFKKRPDGESTFISSLGPGQFFGELSLITRSPCICSFVCQEACTLLKLRAEDFVVVMEQYPRVYDLLQAVSEERYQELHAFEELWCDLSTVRTPVT